ncbi:Coiled-coil domain-containing protein 137, partial [Corvus brachyrhynchos]
RKEKKDNMKPKHPDEQEIPFRLRELMRSREAMKRPDPGKRRAAGGGAVGPFSVGPSPWIPSMDVWEQSHRPASPSWRKSCGIWGLPFQKKKLEKARKKKEEKKEAMLEKSLFQDKVPFGEVVTQPPTITSQPRGQGPAKQAGRKQLLLTARLGQSQASLASPASPVSPVMSMARRRILEEERARVIRAYRDIQRRKQLEREHAQG